MKLLENVRIYEVDEMVFSFRFGTETETHYDGCNVCGGYIPKSKTRPLTIDEQVDYLYGLCCQPHSRWDDLTELCKAFPEIRGALLRNVDHKNRDEIKFKLKFSLRYPDMP